MTPGNLLAAASILYMLSSPAAGTERLRPTTIATTSPEAIGFLLQADADPNPEFALLDALSIRIVEIDSAAGARNVRLPKDTTVFDLRDIDSDGQPNLVVLTPESLCYWRIAPSRIGVDADWCLHNESYRIVEGIQARPFPLVVRAGETFLIDVPVPNTPSITLEGKPARPSVAPGGAEAPPVAHFYVWPVASSDLAPDSEQAFRYDLAYDPPLSDANSEEISAAGRPFRMRGVVDAPASLWPWFPLRRDADEVRVLFALAPPEFRDTLIRFQREERRNLPGPSESRHLTTGRRFPGVIIDTPDAPPDFNGDGFADLLLWRSPRPGRSVGGLLRATQHGVWAVTLSIHLYDPHTQRYRTRPDAYLRLKAPIGGLLSASASGPFPLIRLEDCDGDGRTELVLGDTPRTLSIWRFKEGLPNKPDYQAAFSEPIDAIELTRKLPGGGWLAVVRSKNAWHVVSLP